MRHLLAVAFCLAVAIPLGAAADGPPAATTAEVAQPWKAVAASGSVHNRVDEIADWMRVRRGDQLEERSLVKTGDKGRTTLVRRASVIVLDPSSELQLPESGNGAGETVRQRAGRAIYEIEREGRAFEVETPYLVAGVKGTVFAVSVNDAFAVVSVEKGVVEVRTGAGAVLELREGDAVLVDARDPEDIDVLRMSEPRGKRDGTGLRGERGRRNARERHVELERAALDRIGQTDSGERHAAGRERSRDGKPSRNDGERVTDRRSGDPRERDEEPRDLPDDENGLGDPTEDLDDALEEEIDNVEEELEDDLDGDRESLADELLETEINDLQDEDDPADPDPGGGNSTTRGDRQDDPAMDGGNGEQ